MSDTLACRLRRYLVTDPRVGSVERLVAVTEAALAGGMTAVQLRVPGWEDRQWHEAAVALRDCCHRAGALLVVNNRIDIALAAGADGVHLGASDLPVDVARRLLGRRAVIGYSPEGDGDRRAAEAAGADYLGVGPVYGTTTKMDAGPAVGIEGLARVVAATPLPVVGIGGITPERAAEVVATGAVGVAVVSAIFLAVDPCAAAARLRETVP